MLTAGALVLGATQIPWGVFGAAPGMGVSDCVTASPSDEGYLVTVTTGAGERASIEMVVTDPATGGVRLTGVEQADGVWVFTDADGNPVEATLIGDGRYGVRLSGTSGDFTYSVEAPDGGRDRLGPPRRRGEVDPDQCELYRPCAHAFRTCGAACARR